MSSLPSSQRPLLELCAAFLRLGATSFGGPVAHLGYIRAECVQRRGWLADDEYADVVALCQFLPGPASSQVVFALGMRRAGVLGGLAASLCFLLPSAALMIAFAYGIASMGDLSAAGWLHGLKLAAVAVVAQAVWAMGLKLCPDRARATVCFVAGATTLLLRGPLAQVAVIAGGAALGAVLLRDVTGPRTEVGEPARARAHVAAVAALVGFGALLVVPRIVAEATGDRRVAVLDAFYRAGALVFGGGHVVLPLLREALVPHGWVTDDAFLAGYGAAQAVPGPLFSLAAYLGAVAHAGPRAWLGGVAAVLAIFLPSWLLVAGTLPFWRQVRAKPSVQAAMRGANAAVVGVLLAALYTPVATEAVRSAADMATVLLAFGLLDRWKAPPWAVVVVAAGAGQWLLPT